MRRSLFLVAALLFSEIPAHAGAWTFRCQELIGAFVRPPGLTTLHSELRFDQIQKLGVEVLKLYNPRDHLVVGIGRSPFPLTSFLNEVRPGSAIDIPVSYNRPNPWFQLEKLNPFRWPERKFPLELYSRSPASREQIFRHLDAYFPPPETMVGRKIVLTDFADFGTSLLNFHADLEAYLKFRNLNYEVELLFLDNRSHARWYWPNGTWYRKMHEDLKLDGAMPAFRVIDVGATSAHRELGRLLDREELKEFAPYASFRIVDGVPSTTASPHQARAKFRLFRRAMENDFYLAERNDPTFRAMVQELRSDCCPGK